MEDFYAYVFLLVVTTCNLLAAGIASVSNLANRMVAFHSFPIGRNYV